MQTLFQRCLCNTLYFVSCKSRKVPNVLTGVALLRPQCASSPPPAAGVHCGDGAGAGGGGKHDPHHVDEGAQQQVPHDQLEKVGSNGVHGAGYSGQLFLSNVTFAEPQPQVCNIITLLVY